MEVMNFLMISLIFPSVTVAYSPVMISGFTAQTVQTHTDIVTVFSWTPKDGKRKRKFPVSTHG